MSGSRSSFSSRWSSGSSGPSGSSASIARRLLRFTALVLLLTAGWGIVAYALADRYDGWLARFAGGLLAVAEAGGPHTRLTAVEGGVDVRPADPSLPEVRLLTAERHLSAPLVLALLTVGVGGALGPGRRLRRVVWGVAILFAVHTAGLLADAMFRPLLEVGYRGAVYYVYRFFWWVLAVWTILLLPAGAALYVYLSGDDAAPERSAGIGRSAGRVAALAGSLLLFAGLLVVLQRSVHADPTRRETARAEAALYDPAALTDARTAFLEGRFGDAEAGYRETLAAAPTDVSARFNLGVSLYRQGRFDEAIAELQELRRQAPGFPGLDLALGAALHDAGRIDEARAEFRTADLSTVSDVVLLEQVGTVMLAAGEWQPAQAAFQRLLAVDPNSGPAMFHLGSIALSQGNADQALQWFERARSVLPDSLEVLNNLGVLYQKAGRLDEAVDAYQEAVRLDPQALAATFNLGKLLLDLGQPCTALPQFRRCLELPDMSGAHERCRRLVDQISAVCPS